MAVQRSVPLTLGVTGHRDIPLGEVPLLEERLRELFVMLAGRYPHTPLRLLTPLAEGGDRIAARVARDLGIEQIVPLPLPVTDYEQDFATTDSRQEFRALIAAAETVDVRALDAGCSSSDHRDQAYARAGIYTSEHCQILIALWDGKAAENPGGTADVVEYHQFGEMAALGRATDRSGLALDDTDLVLHLVCSRDRAGGQPADGLEPGCTRWLQASPERTEVESIPVALDLMIRRTGAFNRDLLQHATDASPASVLPGWSEAMADQPELALTADFFSCADQLAGRFSARYHLALRFLYLLAALMGLFFIAYADLNHPSMIYAYLALFVVGLVSHQLVARREWHRKFLDYRALAEGLRIQFYWQLAGVSGQLRNDFAYDNFLRKQDVEIGWIRNVMRFAGAPQDRAIASDSDVDRVIDIWIGDASSNGQLAYFESRSRTHQNHVLRTTRLVAVTLWVGIAITVALALFQGRFGETWVTLMVAATGILPLAAALREAYSHKRADKELLKQYQFMLEIYRTARFRLSRCESVAQKRELLRALGETALDEHAQWIVVQRERPPEPGNL